MTTTKQLAEKKRDRSYGWQERARKKVESNEARNKIIKEYLSYDPLTGILTWKESRPFGNRKNSIAGAKKRKKYMVVCIDHKNSFVHRVAWFLHYGKWPDGQVDHINGDFTDNRIENLREATSRENNQNRAGHRNGRLVGTTKRKEGWQSFIHFDNSPFYLGVYRTEEEASAAYNGALCLVNKLEKKTKESRIAYLKLEKRLEKAKELYSDVVHDHVPTDYDGRERTRDEMKSEWLNYYDQELEKVEG